MEFQRIGLLLETRSVEFLLMTDSIVVQKFALRVGAPGVIFGVFNFPHMIYFNLFSLS